MSNAVEIYVKYAGPVEVLARRVAEALELTWYFRSGRGFLSALEVERWIGEPTWAGLRVDPTESGHDNELLPEEWAFEEEPTADAPYDYQVGLDMRGPQEWIERLGRMVFDRLTGFDLPLAFVGENVDILADFLPGRGVREFPPGTSASEAGRAQWWEPRLHDDPAAPWRPEPPPPVAPPGRVTVFETGGLLQMVPLTEGSGGWRWIAPVTSIRVDGGARDIGLLLGSALTTTAPPERDDRAAIEEQLRRVPNAGIEDVADFGRRSVSVEVRSDGTAVAAIPHGPHRGAPDAPPSGSVIEELVRQESSADLDPAALGQLVLDLVAAVRERVPA
ncbi:hypothetical protein WEI85_09940 [Actinomycetes bacterium KLBMP 9797]